jgi:hypothetical protein
MSNAADLQMHVQKQTQTLWCWAACSSSTSVFFQASSTWTQCRLADAELSQRSCCVNGGSSGCNQPWYVHRALSRTGNLAGRTNGAATWDEVTREIDAGRPVCARIDWGDKTGHFVLITGYSETGDRRTLEVEDPWTGSASVELDEFTKRYQSRGTWSHTYFTRA